MAVLEPSPFPSGDVPLGEKADCIVWVGAGKKMTFEFEVLAIA